MSQHVLVAYASGTGSTGEVAGAIGEEIRGPEVQVTVTDVESVADLTPYTAVVVGSSIRVGRWLPEAITFVTRFAAELTAVPVAYFTTCLAMINDTAENREKVLAYMAPLKTLAPNVEPVGLGLFAGSFDPQRQQLVPHLSMPQGDYRDWHAIRSWACEITAALTTDRQPTPTGKPTLAMAMLSFTDMSGTDLSQHTLDEASLHQAALVETDLAGATMRNADLSQANLQLANLQEADLHWTNLQKSDLRQANLHQANLIGANLEAANLQQAILSQTVLNGAQLHQANLQQATLTEADLNWADFKDADLTDADLRGAQLHWANFRGAILTGVRLTGAYYNDFTVWPADIDPADFGCIHISVPQ